MASQFRWMRPFVRAGNYSDSISMHVGNYYLTEGLHTVDIPHTYLRAMREMGP